VNKTMTDFKMTSKETKTNIPPEELYKAMSAEAAGLYNQMITLTTTFLAGC